MINLYDKFNIAISDEIKEAILISSSIAEKNNIDIYLIGGIVRDLIIENQIKDVDIALEYDALEFGKILTSNCNCEIINTQENLHTIKVKFESGIVIDFASTREEKYLKSGVLPTAYNFGCKLKDDVKRRDFTINTLALKLTGNDKFSLVDYYDGYSDIKNKKIRILHNRSFIDDPSRIVRALKFKVRLDFEIDENTYFLMQDYLQNTDKQMPLERIKNELRQYFSISKDNLYRYFLNTNAYKLFCDNPPIEINNDYLQELKNYDFFESVDYTQLHLLALFVNCDYEQTRYNLLSTEKKILKEINTLLQKEEKEFSNNEKIYSAFSDLSEIAIIIYYSATGNKAVIKFLTALKEINVLITGKDLIDLGFIPSPYFNELFEKILKEKLNGKLKTKEEEKNFIKKFLK